MNDSCLRQEYHSSRRAVQIMAFFGTALSALLILPSFDEPHFRNLCLGVLLSGITVLLVAVNVSQVRDHREGETAGLGEIFGIAPAVGVLLNLVLAVIGLTLSFLTLI